MLTGEFYNTIDDKGRILIPSRLRSALEGEALYVTRGLETCLWLMLPSDFEKLKNTIISGPGAMFDRKLRILQRGMIAPAQLCEFDKVGRINIPQSLRESVGLSAKEESVLLGTGNYLELWNRAEYERYLSQSMGEFLDAAQSLSEMIREDL
ncbi:MAG: division/cell wall cluster transcriptional repressor MraZ [Sphaerochaeta sp.]|uniref:division/cell wall cluster transcriptional repressor MraZ n=1 Tax=Sphaerochaeta sp. TaxID=1972642 RepID=UPI001D701F26|nr:division/cell wall cluster transcriptional repressor MraZ [uncultured Sphaerochaeta sp.]MDD3058002.1 division/cell wall cluster transcriptional repressor MraZ [Sphaerochaeta sp.]MDD3929207.1 division/cell wall cluster transcriptional repressor MraZ [Sphaerochaeta sp.]NCC11884.1 division/cell wall cluster transcriptional repressor MraZ [Spirochaetia bacterium]NCC88903.1 division/cell wall cluster transcriptional repressor MraZ [Spirochaetia bacterium]